VIAPGEDRLAVGSTVEALIIGEIR
jgi:hypothetical protein